MRLSLEQIRTVTCGATTVEQEEDGVHFYRFTQEQMELYKVRNADFYSKALSTAGVRFCFRTDSRTLALKATLTPQSGVRRYYSFDVYADGEPVAFWNNYEGTEMTGNYTGTPLPVGDFSREIVLAEGEKEVCIHLPWNMRTCLKGLYLDDGATLIPVKKEKKLLCFGDSITQGFDALCPSHRYISVLADHLNAEECNRAIGGEVFFPALAETGENFVPDIITVAYGTNDFMHVPVERFLGNCKNFYENLHRNYPNTPIFAITPIWRKNQISGVDQPDFQFVEKYIREVTEKLSNVTVIRGYELVPHDPDCFGDLVLHPNDKGFKYYANNLIQSLKL